MHMFLYPLLLSLDRVTFVMPFITCIKHISRLEQGVCSNFGLLILCDMHMPKNREGPTFEWHSQLVNIVTVLPHA